MATGEGQYGKVYTCINVDTGELMAMKEVGVLPRCYLGGSVSLSRIGKKNNIDSI